MRAPQRTTTAQTKQESEQLEYLLVGDLRQLLTEPKDAWTRSFILVILNRLLMNYRRRRSMAHNKVKRTDEMITQSPRLARQVEAMRSTGSALFPALEALFQRVSADASYDDVSDDVHEALRQWTESFNEHREERGRLRHEAFTMEIGGEG